MPSKRLALIVVIGCSSSAPPPRAVPSKPASPASYQLGGLRIEGAPALDPDRARVRSMMETESARLLDLQQLDGAPEPTALVALGGWCQLVDAAGRAWVTKEHCEPGWARLTRWWAPVYLRERADEVGALMIGAEKRSRAGTLIDPIWELARSHAFYGVAEAAELWMSTDSASSKIAGNGPWAPLDVSADGKFVLARREVAFARAGLYLIELGTGHAVALTDPEHRATRARFVGNDVLAIVERDDRRVLEWISTRWRTQVARVDGDIESFAITPHGIVAVVEDGGLSTLELIDPATGNHHVIVNAPEGGVIRDLMAVGTMIAFTFESPTQPREVQAFTLGETAVPKFRLSPATVVAPQPSIHEVVAADGVASQLFAFTPKGNKRPVIVELHGGPEDRWLPGYDRFVHFATSQGFAVVRPNVRGSAGRGSTFANLDDGARRDDVLRDVKATLDWIAAQANLDASRVVVMGTSYGGYLALSALHAFPDRLRGGITLSAITDLVGFLAGTAPYRRDHRRAEYGDERDPTIRARLAALSPRSWVKELKRPLLMAYGERDPRVPPATSAAFIADARSSGATVWSIAAADEGHWFEHAENRRAFDVLAMQFLEIVNR